MGSITTGVGLISGIDIAGLIDSLIALESRPKFRLQERIQVLQSQQTALLDVNARLLNLGNAAAAFRRDRIFRSALATSTNEAVMTATAGTSAQPGTFKFIAKQLVSTSQQMTKGFADRDTTPLGLSQLSFEFGKGRVFNDAQLANLNGGASIDRGRIIITDGTGATATIDFTDVTTLNEAIGRINATESVSVSATIEGDGLVVTDTSGGAGTLIIADAAGDTTATDLGIAGSGAGGVLTGTTLNYLGGSTALTFLNDGRGVLVRNNVPDLRITARDGSIFEVDLGRVDADITTDTDLDELNNGAGVRLNGDSEEPDITFIARDGTEYEVDLTGATTVGGVIGRVSTATGGHIQLSITDGDKLTVTDTVGGAGNLRVEGAGGQGNATAEDLGILNETGVAADSFDGALIPNTISDPPATTIQDVIDRINAAMDTALVDNGGRIMASIAADGVSLQIDDTSGGAGNLIVASTSGNPHAASQLGIETDPAGVAASTVSGGRLISALNSVLVSSLNGGAGLTTTSAATLGGATLLADLFQGAGLTTNGSASSPDIFVQDRLGNTYHVEVDGLSTVQDLIDAFDSTTGGAVTLAINGQQLEATHNAGAGAFNFQIQNLNGAGAAGELGLLADNTALDGDVVTGVDTQPAGPAVAATTITITDRAGASLTLSNLDTFHSLSQIIDTINDEAVAQGVAITVGYNAAGNGLQVTDSSAGAGNLTITGDAAGALGIAADVASSRVLGGNLQLHYVGVATRLEDLNYGRGVGTGTFRITDGLGQSAEVIVSDTDTTLYDVIAKINSRGLGINARVNDNGDGLLIEANLGGQSAIVPLKVENVSGSTARDLNLLGSSDDVGDSAVIDGSYERIVEVSPSDSLDDVMNAINEAGVPAAASILNAGAGPSPFHLNLTSQITGARGEMIIDTGGVDLGIQHISRGRDAKVFFGSDDPASAFLITSPTNSLTNVVQGVTIDLHQQSDEAVDITVTRDNEAILEAVNNFVTSFNDAIGRIDQYDRFDLETEERGVLLGNPTVGRVRQALYRVALGPAEGVGGQFRFLHQVGITIGSGGEMQFDQEKFQAAYDDDPDAVEELFAAFEGSSGSTTTEIAPGVTITEDSSTITARGFGQLIDDLIESMTNSVDGTVTNADKNFDTLIELAEDRIEAIDDRLARRREVLQRQFTAMETALARLQSQQGALTNLSSNILLSQSALLQQQ